MSIGSILSQTFPDFELIIINDGSTDGSAEIINSMRDKRIQFVDNKVNQGTATVSNQALRLAKGEFIALMDADDFSFPNRFDRQIEFMDANPDVGVLGTAFFFSDTKKILAYPGKDEQIRFDMFLYYPFRNPTLMLRGGIIRDFQLKFNPVFKYTLDYEFISRAIGFTKAANLDEPLLVYTVHEQQVSTVKNEIFIEHADLVSIFMLTHLGIDLTTEEADLYVKLRHGDIDSLNAEKVLPLLRKVKAARVTNPLFRAINLNLLADRLDPVRKHIVASKNVELKQLLFMLRNLRNFDPKEICKYSLKAFFPNRA